MTRLIANGGALLNSVMCRVSKEPDTIFLQVGGNDFPRTAWNQRNARQRGLLWVAFCSVAISSGCLYEYAMVT